MLKNKLERWKQNGLISQNQYEDILSFESQHKVTRGMLGRWMSGASFFAIFLGVLSIIAANWGAISPEVKIITHLFLNIAAAFFVWRTEYGSLKREGAVFAYSALVLTMIALTGQVYQLQGTVAGALILWMILITPVVFIFSRDLWCGLPWMIAFLTTIMCAMLEYLDSLPDQWARFMYVLVITLLPLAFMADGKLEFFRKYKENYADMFLNTGLILLAFNTTMSSFLWYEKGIWYGLHRDEGMRFFYLILLIAALALIWLYYFYSKYRKNEIVFQGYILSSICTGLIILPFLSIIQFNGDVLAYLVFILVWVLFGWYGQVTDKTWLVKLSVFFVSIRIFTVYIELIGTLMNTGVALLMGGILALVLIWIARKTSIVLKKNRKERKSV